MAARLQALHPRPSLGSVVEGELALATLDDEGALACLLDHARVNQVTHEDGRVPVVVGLLLRVGQLHLDLLEAGELGPDLVLPVEIGFLVRLDLGLGSSSLRGCLEHVGADAVLDYKWTEGSEPKGSWRDSMQPLVPVLEPGSSR